MINPYLASIEDALRDLCGYGDTVPGEGQVPLRLGEAMSYSLLAGGKRLRPTLLLAAYSLVRDDWQRVIPFAASLEMIHTYSLIHDDLPAMDNDDLRRGRPTNHKVFGEDVAILAGDGLQNLAMETMMKACLSFQPMEGAVRATESIVRHAGVTGMIAGQTLDVTMEGEAPNPETVSYIHAHKTADLMIAPMEAGLFLAGAGEDQLEAGRSFGLHLGLAFQMVDDLLDIFGDEKQLGKRTHTDEAAGKMSWPAVYGVEKTRLDAQSHIEAAIESMKIFGDSGKFLETLAKETLFRVK